MAQQKPKEAQNLTMKEMISQNKSLQWGLSPQKLAQWLSLKAIQASRLN